MRRDDPRKTSLSPFTPPDRYQDPSLPAPLSQKNDFLRLNRRHDRLTIS